MPYHQRGALGRIWEEAGQSPRQRRTGTAVLGMPHPGSRFPEDGRDDIDLFAFPETGPSHGQEPAEGWDRAVRGVTSRRSRQLDGV